MRAAVIDPASGNVVNVIVADAAIDAAPADHLLIDVPDGLAIDHRWQWNSVDGFKPGPELQAELDAEAAAEQAAVEQEAWA